MTPRTVLILMWLIWAGSILVSLYAGFLIGVAL